MANQVRLVFSGEIIDGFDKDSVRRALAEKMKRSPSSLFSGKRVVLKEGLEEVDALNILAALEALGAKVAMEEVEAPPPMAPLSFLDLQVPAAAPTAEPPKENLHLTDSGWQALSAALEIPDTSRPLPVPHSTPAPAPRGFPPIAPPQDNPATDFLMPAAVTAGSPPPPLPPRPVPPLSYAPAPALPTTEATAASPEPAQPASMANVNAVNSLSMIDSLAKPTPEGMPDSALQVVCPTCNDRQVMRVLCRVCGTDLKRALAAKQEERELARASELQAIRAKRGLTLDGSLLYADSASIWGLGFSGRLARWPYAASGLMVYAAMGGLALTLIKHPGALTLIGAVVGFLLLMVWSLRLTVLRLHDLNFSGWWTLGLFVPYVGTIGSLVLMLWPGTPGDNDHGEPARPGNWILALFSFLVLAMTIGMGWRTFTSALNKEWREAEDEEAQISASVPTPGPVNPQPPLSMMAPPAESEVANHVASPQAIADLRQAYWPLGSNKAFAASSDGTAWAWRGDAASVTQAVAGALADCESKRKPETPECKVINLNGYWQQ